MFSRSTSKKYAKRGGVFAIPKAQRPVHVLTDTRPPSRDPTPLVLRDPNKKTLLHKHAMHVKVMPITQFTKHIKKPDRNVHTPNDVTKIKLTYREKHETKIWDERSKVWVDKPVAAMDHFPHDSGEAQNPTSERSS
jgi:hypothetical protein